MPHQPLFDMMFSDIVFSLLESQRQMPLKVLFATMLPDIVLPVEELRMMLSPVLFDIVFSDIVLLLEEYRWMPQLLFVIMFPDRILLFE
jgi:hypothetical protein